MHGDEPGLTVFPNPSGGSFTVMNINVKADRLAIYNSLGVCTGRYDISSMKGQVTMTTNLPAGLYYLQATQKGRPVGSAKVIIE